MFAESTNEVACFERRKTIGNYKSTACAVLLSTNLFVYNLQDIEDRLFQLFQHYDAA